MNCSGKRTIVYFSGERLQKHGESAHNPWGATDRVVQDKVLSDKRSVALAATIWDIENGPYGGMGWWSECKDCDSWYKSERTVLSEARF